MFRDEIAKIIAEGELPGDATFSKMEIVQQEGKRQVKRQVEHYSLDAIISVGYRVNSIRATHFRIWATKVLKEYMIKGFALDDERLKQGEDYNGCKFKIDNKEVYEDTSWKEQFEDKNRICYVIETMPENLYCGECAVKDISANIPEIEIELMKEYQHQGIGYKAINMLLSKLAKEYGKLEFYAKIEPDNYASQFLFEKLIG